MSAFPQESRFLTPDEAGKLSEKEEQSLAGLRLQINNLLVEQYVPGITECLSFDADGTTPIRVVLNVCKGLKAASWGVEMTPCKNGAEVQKYQILIHPNGKGSIAGVPAGPSFVDKRNRS